MHFCGGGIYFDDVTYYLFEKRDKRILTKCNLHLPVHFSHPATELSMPIRSFSKQSVTGTSYKQTLFITEL